MASVSKKCDYDCRWDRRWRALPDWEQRRMTRLAGCETRGVPWRKKARKHDNATGYTYHGAIQFSNSTWRAAQVYMKRDRRTRRHAHDASLHHQLTVGAALARNEGMGHWPVCG